MDASAIKRAFRGPVGWGNLGWSFHSRGRQWPRQKLTLVFVVHERSLRGYLSRKNSASEKWVTQKHLSDETLAILRSLLKPKDIAACTAAALTYQRSAE